MNLCLKLIDIHLQTTFKLGICTHCTQCLELLNSLNVTLRWDLRHFLNKVKSTFKFCHRKTQINIIILDCSMLDVEEFKVKNHIILVLLHFDLGMYYFVNMVLTATSIIIGTIVVNIARNNKSKPPVPKVIRFVSMQAHWFYTKWSQGFTHLCVVHYLFYRSHSAPLVFSSQIYNSWWNIFCNTYEKKNFQSPSS